MPASSDSNSAFVLSLAEVRHSDVVGGKAINLVRLTQAGFLVPDGFVITTHAFRSAAGRLESVPPAVADAVVGFYRDIGSPAVAVRSSATAEDLDDASMAGQYETFLNVQGETALLDAVARCWQSIRSSRSCAYLAEHGLSPDEVAMAVVVQRMIPADKAGVLFTANPRKGSQHEFLLEANWGLGETVVSGLVQPDTLVLDRATGSVKSCTIADKQVWLEPGTREPRPLPDDKRHVGCLDSKDVHALWQIGLKVMDHFACPVDIEWAIADGQVYLLQSRAVTTLENAEAFEELLSDVRAQLRAAKDAGRGDWARHNIGETLPHPTPLTWSVIQRFMNGAGGYGAMHKRVGFEPSVTVCKEGFLDLIGGRIYMDLSRAPDMFFENFPFSYDIELLRRNPDALQGPPTISSGSIFDQIAIARRLRKVNTRLRSLARDVDKQLTGDIIPRFRTYVQDEKQVDLSALSTTEWFDLWRRRQHEVLDWFAAESLLPSLIAAMSLADLRAFVCEQFWNEDPDELVNCLSAGGDADLTIAADQGLHDLAEGKSRVDDWLDEFGHRAPEEFDLSAPRWRERPELVARLAARMKGNVSPLARHEARRQAARSKVAALAASLSPRLRRDFTERLEMVYRYIRFREDAKHYLMLGYDLLRDMLLDAGRRLDIGDGVFYLSIEELHDALLTGIAPLHLIERRRERRMAEKRLDLPDVITEADIHSLGESLVVEAGDRLDAFVLSGGICSGPARIVFSPVEAGELGEGYVLVCPSTDPSWTPLFVAARGVILERGGTLSHGAIVARELGLPAVVLARATRLLSDGEPVSIDGQRGFVLRHADTTSSTKEPPAPTPNDTRIEAHRMPPICGQTERRGAVVRNCFLFLWALFFGFYALMPQTIGAASFRLLDAILLPVIAAAGKPFTVGLVAGGFAVLTIVGQKLLTDNRRLRVARRRAAGLQAEARNLPRDSPRYRALMASVAPVQMRIVKAAFVPLAIFLGPMIVSFLWLPQRVDTAVRNAKPGCMVKVTAIIDGDCDQPVRLAVADPLGRMDSTDAEQQIFLARPPLERHLQKLRETQSDLKDLPWDQALAIERLRGNYLSELESFLSGDMPNQQLSWAVSTPENVAGKWPMTLSVSVREQVTVYAVLGEGHAPEPKEDRIIGAGDRQRIERRVQCWRSESADALIREVQVRYRDVNPIQGEGTFWRPLNWFEIDESSGPIKSLFSPWLVLYIAVYVIFIFVLKSILRVA